MAFYFPTSDCTEMYFVKSIDWGCSWLALEPKTGERCGFNLSTISEQSDLD